MQIWLWLCDFYQEERVLTLFLIVSSLLLVAAAFASCQLREVGILSALWVIVCGVLSILIVVGTVGERAGWLGGGMLLVFGGVIYLFTLLVLFIKDHLTKRKRLREEVVRRLCYTLPDRENEYVRSRLNTALQLPEKELGKDMGGTETKKMIKLAYTRQLLSKVKTAPLTQAERLYAEEMSRTFSLYLNKEGWSAEDLRAVNELCAALLKLSAKYAV